MSDIDAREFNELVKELRKVSGELGRVANVVGGNGGVGSTAGSNGRANAARQVERDLKRKTLKERYAESVGYKATQQVEKSGEVFKALSGDMTAFSQTLRRFTKMVPGGVMMGALVGWGKNLVDNWKSLSDVGQSFNGSMFGMAKAAADAGLPLGEFAEIVKKNSKVMAVFGQRDVMSLMKSVRKAGQEQGLYGFTIAQLNEVSGQYLEMQRLMGVKDAARNGRTEKSVSNFAKTLTSLATATGKSRDEIMKATMDVMADIAITTKYFGTGGVAAQQFADNTMKAVATLGALPGKAGEVFSKMLGEASGYGTSLFGEGANMFIEAGMGQMVGATDKLATAIQGGGQQAEAATTEYLIDFKKQTENNMAALRLQAQTGNQSAKQVLEMYSQIQGMTDKQIANMTKQQASTKNMTAFFASISNVLQSLLGGVFGRIMEHFENIDKSMSNIFREDTFKAMEDTFVSLGIGIGDWLKNLKPEDIKAWADAIKGGINIFLGLVNIVGMVGKALLGIGTFVDKITKPILGKNSSIAGAITMAAAFLFGPALLKFIGGKLLGTFGKFFSSMMGQRVKSAYITADDVHIGGGGGLGGGDMRGRRARGGRGRFGGRASSRLARMRGGAGRGLLGRAGGLLRGAGLFGGLAAGGAGLMMGGGALADVIDGVDGIAGSEAAAIGKSAAAKTAGSAAISATAGAAAKAGGKGMLKGLGKGLGKTLLSKIPLIGLGMGAVGAYHRLKEGDGVGAGMSALSGLASTIPGWGTAASLGIDAAMIARDAVGTDKTDKAVGSMFAGIAAQTTQIQRTMQNNQPSPQTDQNMAILVQQQKDMYAMQEQQIALLKEQVTALKAIARTNKAVESNTSA